jgi:hypothetical protein
MKKESTSFLNLKDLWDIGGPATNVNPLPVKR